MLGGQMEHISDVKDVHCILYGGQIYFVLDCEL